MQKFTVTYTTLTLKTKSINVKAEDADDAEFQARLKANRPKLTWLRVVSVTQK